MPPTVSITSDFVVGGLHLDIDALTKVAGRSPTKIGAPKLGRFGNDPGSIPLEWQYRMERRAHWSIDSAIRELLDLFEERRDHITAFVEQNHCYMHVRLRLYGSPAVIVCGIEPATLARLARYGCGMSFSLGS